MDHFPALYSTGCPICGSQQIYDRFELEAGHRIRVCPDCQVRFLFPQLNDQALGQLYSERYYASWGVSGKEDNEITRRMKILSFRPRLELIRRRVGTGRILDVGCATGYFLELAREEGYEPYGVEYSGYAAEVAAQKLGKDRVFTGILENSGFAEGSFCAVVMTDLLEHVRDPQRTLLKAGSLLSPGGVILIVTPDTDAISNRLMGRRWLHYKSEHFFYFNRHSIEKLAAACDLELAHFERSKKALNLDYLYTQLTVYRHWLLTPAIGLLHRVLPAWLKARNFYFSIGEMAVLLKKKIY